MITVNSRSRKDIKYSFECLNFLRPEHFSEGLFVGVPCELERTLEVDPNKYQTLEQLSTVVLDCAHPELVAAYQEGYLGLRRFLSLVGVFEDPFKVHVLRVK